LIEVSEFGVDLDQAAAWTTAKRVGGGYLHLYLNDAIHPGHQRPGNFYLTPQDVLSISLPRSPDFCCGRI
jgi:hypothetical protein